VAAHPCAGSRPARAHPAQTRPKGPRSRSADPRRRPSTRATGRLSAPSAAQLRQHRRCIIGRIIEGRKPFRCCAPSSTADQAPAAGSRSQARAAQSRPLRRPPTPSTARHHRRSAPRERHVPTRLLRPRHINQGRRRRGPTATAADRASPDSALRRRQGEGRGGEGEGGGGS
jgi:hypothetical protein